jgi:hypothetical protein
MLRLELLKVEGDLERELAKLVLNCTACGQEVRWVQGISVSDAGHWWAPLPGAARRTGGQITYSGRSEELCAIA